MASGQLRARSFRGVVCLALTAAAAVGAAAAPGASGPPSPSPSSSGSPHAGERQSPLAGWPAGAGRERPGRSATEVAREDAREDREQRAEETAPAALPAFTPDPDDFPGPLPAGRQALNGATVERVQQVSLGAGIALVGLGLGFLALRMRRAR
ncbi:MULTISPECIES: hypothetical protein [unclassified Streptomyces]|uniref:hypothetical protein n=1 Tax=unclassified Streptomyces TaxID=2593676 RepID=UPI002ED0636E|nr:hypothetical protein OH827_16265 [Streptomyces sp. NBC_00891]WSY06472.1 hypothetical protein OG464_16265 [Streptomyces sp. NBC_00890]WSZ08096.1 hypothetical protein OG704_16265 [Streptomyces sp. NBC_00869]WSZ24404.1 hypothetical protein OG498_17300 [Streptomyces sp. NBC_00870]